MKQLTVPKRWIAFPVAAVLLAALVPGVASADGVESGWQLRLYAAGVDMEQSSVGRERQPGFTGGFDSDWGGGLGVNAEYRFSRRLGVELGLFSGGEVDVAATYGAGGSSWATYDSLTFTPLTVGLDVHLTPDARVDLYACPLVALVQYGSLSAVAGPGVARSTIDFDSDVALGAGLGLGVPFGNKRWSFQANLTYLDSSLEGRAADGRRIDAGFDTTIVGVGFGYRFRPRSQSG